MSEERLGFERNGPFPRILFQRVASLGAPFQVQRSICTREERHRLRITIEKPGARKRQSRPLARAPSTSLSSILFSYLQQQMPPTPEERRCLGRRH